MTKTQLFTNNARSSILKSSWHFKKIRPSTTTLRKQSVLYPEYR